MRNCGLADTCRIYQASTSELYGKVESVTYNTDSPIYIYFDEFGDEIRDKYIFYKDPRDPNAVFTYDCINPKYIQKFINNEWKNII